MEEEKPKSNPRGGRPKKAATERREHFVMLSFTKPEYDQLQAEMKDAGFKEAATYVRRKLLLREDQLIYNPRESLNALHTLGTEVAAIGKNINQIARYVNYLKGQGQLKPEVLEKYSEQLGELTRAELQVGKAVKQFFRLGGKNKSGGSRE